MLREGQARLAVVALAAWVAHGANAPGGLEPGAGRAEIGAVLRALALGHEAVGEEDGQALALARVGLGAGQAAGASEAAFWLDRPRPAAWVARALAVLEERRLDGALQDGTGARTGGLRL